LQRFDLLCGCSQPQGDAIMRWGKTELIGKRLAADALEENEIEQAARRFF
jgi:hypothetical protein